MAREPACTHESTVSALEVRRVGRLDPGSEDPARTTVQTVAMRRLARDRYRIMYRVRFLERSGAAHDVLTVQEASPEGCTVGHIEFFVSPRAPAAPAGSTSP